MKPLYSLDSVPINGCVALLSGGLDSTVMVALLRRLRPQMPVYTLSVDYGQKHAQETVHAILASESLGCKDHRHIEVKLDLGSWDDLPIRTLEEIRASRDPNPAFLPGRNLILLSFALAWAEVLDLEAVAIAATIDDHAGFPDCRREFFDAVEKASGRQVISPFTMMRKLEIVEMGSRWPEVDFAKTWTCYTPIREISCGRCDACLLRLDAFERLGLDDPLEYAVRL